MTTKGTAITVTGAPRRTSLPALSVVAGLALVFGAVIATLLLGAR